jgi:hypothetical protein
VLYAEEIVDPSAIEVIALVAGAILEKHLRLYEPVRREGGPVRAVSIKDGSDMAGSRGMVDAVTLAATAPPRAQDAKLLEAERFARAEVARLLLAYTDSVSEGRRRRDLSAALGPQLTALRAAFKERFPESADRLHREIVRTLARDDDSVLGRGYSSS